MTGVTDLFDELERSQLLTATQLAELRGEVEQTTPDLSRQAVAQRLVDRRLLTPWQAGRLLSGQTAFFLGKYKLLDELGRGGMGAVFKAQQAPLGRIVAIKVMAEKLIRDEMAVARFHREIRAAAALNDPHVVAAFDADQVQNTHFLVMEYVPGEGLDALLKRARQLPIATACELVRQAALGLQHAHELGMAHRDIKPGNLLISRDEHGAPLVKILDLGLARFTSGLREDVELTSTGQVMGTPDYIAPEQARSTHSADIRSDIFSLGCTLFRALTGVLPFEGDSVVAKLMARALGEAPPLREFLPAAPVALEAIVAKMMARDPAARFQIPRDVAEVLLPFCVAERAVGDALPSDPRPSESLSRVGPLDVPADPALEHFLRNLAHEAALDEPPETAPSQVETQFGVDDSLPAAVPPKPGTLRAGVEVRRQADRKARLWIAAGAAALIGLVGAGWGWQRPRQSQLVIDWPPEERREARLEIDGFVIGLPESGPLPVHRGFAGTRKLRLERRGYETIETVLELARGDMTTFRPEWKPTPMTARRKQFSSLQQQVQSFVKNAGVGLPAAGDSQLVSLHTEFGRLRLKFLHTSDQSRFEALWRQLPFPIDFLQIPGPGRAAPAIDPVLTPSPPTELVGALGDGRLKSPRLFGSVVANADGTLAVATSAGHPLYLWDLNTGALRCPPFDYFGGFAAFSPDGRYLAWWSRHINVSSLRVNTIRGTIPIENENVAALTWIPGTNQLAWTGTDSAGVHLWDVDAGAPRESLNSPGDKHEITGLVASPDGRQLAGAIGAGRIRIWNIAARNSFDLEPVAAGKSLLAFSPDGRTLACAIDSTILLWDLEARKVLRELTVSAPYLSSLVWPPNGDLRTCHIGQEFAAVWNAHEGNRQVQVAPRGRMHSRVSLSADGRRLVTSGAGGELQVWDAVTGDELLPVPPAFLAAAIDPQGEWVALGTSARTIEYRNLATGAVERTTPLDLFPGALAVSPDRRVLAVAPDHVHGDPGRLVILREDLPPQALTDLAIPQSPVFTPDGSLLLSADWEHIAAWSTDDFRLKFKVALPKSVQGYTLAKLVVTSDGRKVALSAWDDSRGGLVIFSLPEGRQFIADPLGPTTAIAATPDPQTIVFTTGGHVRRFDVEKKTLEGDLQVFPDVNVYAVSLACSPDGEWLACTSKDGQLATIITGFLGPDRFLTLGRPEMVAERVLYTPDGRHVVTLNSNGTIYIVRLQQWSATKPSDRN